MSVRMRAACADVKLKRGSYAILCSVTRTYGFPMTSMNLSLRYIELHNVELL